MVRFLGAYNTLALKFHKCWYGGILVASVSPYLRIIPVLVDVELKLVLHVNVAPLSLEFNCIVSDDVTVVDVLVYAILASTSKASTDSPLLLVQSMIGIQSPA